ncbi:MAG: hypothetical protein ACK5MR_15895 [Cumulibacter sp.]
MKSRLLEPGLAESGVWMGLKRRSVTLLSAGILALALAGCGNDPDTKPTELSATSSSSASGSPSDPAPSSDSSTTSSAPDVDPEEQAVIDAYKGFYTTLNSLTDLSEVAVTEAMSPYAQDVAIQQVLTGTASLASDGHAPGGTVVFAPLEIEFAGSSEATLTECRDTTGETIVDANTGEQVSQGTPGTSITAFLIRSGQDWKVSGFIVKETGC